MSIFIFACDNKTPPRPTPVVKDTELCEAAGRNLKRNQCIEDDKNFTKLGKSFKQFCEETHNAGVYLNPSCLANISATDKGDCLDQMDTCTYSK